MRDEIAPAQSFKTVSAKTFYLPIMRFLKELPKDYVGTMADIQTRYGDLVYLPAYGGFLKMAFISDPTINRELYVRHTDALGKSPSQIQTFLYAAGQSVATAHGEEWRTKRKEANNLFSRQIIEASCAGQVQVIADYVSQLDPTPHDGMALARHMAALTSSRGILGRVISLPEADIQIGFSKAAADRFNVESSHLFARPNWALAPWRRDLTRRKNDVFPIVQKAIDELRGSDVENDGLMNHYVNGDFVTSTDAEMLTILVGLLMGAQDNIAAATGWTLAFLAHNPDIQDQIRDELTDNPANADELGACKMLKATVYEVLRMRPPAMGNQPRILNKDVEIAGQKLPKGTFIFNSFFNMHHAPEPYESPERFDPNRFLDGSLARSPAYAPFGHGPRNCVAQGMAMQQLMATIAGMLRGYKVHTTQRTLPDMEQTPFLVPAPFTVRFAPL